MASFAGSLLSERFRSQAEAGLSGLPCSIPIGLLGKTPKVCLV